MKMLLSQHRLINQAVIASCAIDILKMWTAAAQCHLMTSMRVVSFQKRAALHSRSGGRMNYCIQRIRTSYLLNDYSFKTSWHVNNCDPCTLAKGGSWGQILKLDCWYGLILHKIILKMMYDMTISWKIDWDMDFRIHTILSTSFWL
jgi:hypothetical protein